MELDGHEQAARAGDVVAALFGEGGSRRLSEAARASRAWYAANGDRERAHTTNVWLKKSGRSGVDPILFVEVDASWLALELSCNKEIYLTRLSMRGVAVSDIRFRTGAPKAPREPREDDARQHRSPLPELGEDEVEECRRATEGLPEGLRQSVFRAMCATMRRSRSKNT